LRSRGLVNFGIPHDKRDAGVLQQFRAAGRARGQYEHTYMLQ
jgi:hypothetical protein